jgi:hypothetical protein
VSPEDSLHDAEIGRPPRAARAWRTGPSCAAESVVPAALGVTFIKHWCTTRRFGSPEAFLADALLDAADVESQARLPSWVEGVMIALGSRMLAALATSLLLVLVGLAAFPRAQKPGMVSPPQWEYKTVPYNAVSRDQGPFVERLNREGADGWELADFISDTGPTMGTMVFKRIKQSPAE